MTTFYPCMDNSPENNNPGYNTGTSFSFLLSVRCAAPDGYRGGCASWYNRITNDDHG